MTTPTRRETEAMKQVDSELRRRGLSRMKASECQLALRLQLIDPNTQVFDGELAARVAETIAEARQIDVPSDNEARAPVEKSEQARERAVAIRVADRASELGAVRAFRERHLSAGLIAWANLEGWLRNRPESLVEIALVMLNHNEPGDLYWGENPSDDDFKWCPVVVQRTECHYVPLPLPNHRRTVVPMRAGVIADGYLLAERLTDRTGWDRWSAFVWLFTGEVPELPLMSTRAWWTEGREAVWRVEVTAEADVDPRQVEAAFRSLRSLRHQADAKRAPRTPAKSWEATAWCLRNQTGTWESRMEAFNAAHPEHAFTDSKEFAKSVRAAKKRLPLSSSWAPLPSSWGTKPGPHRVVRSPGGPL